MTTPRKLLVYLTAACAAATLALFAFAATQNVSVEVTDEDREYLARFLPQR